VAAAAVKFTYLGYIRTGWQVALRIDAMGANRPRNSTPTLCRARQTVMACLAQ